MRKGLWHVEPSQRARHNAVARRKADPRRYVLIFPWHARHDAPHCVVLPAPGQLRLAPVPLHRIAFLVTEANHGLLVLARLLNDTWLTYRLRIQGNPQRVEGQEEGGGGFAQGRGRAPPRRDAAARAAAAPAARRWRRARAPRVWANATGGWRARATTFAPPAAPDRVPASSLWQLGGPAVWHTQPRSPRGHGSVCDSQQQRVPQSQ